MMTNHYLRLFLKIIYLLLLLCFVSNFACEKQTTEFKTNSPPVITSVKIIPERPNKESELRLIVQSHDPDRDPIQYDYRWIKNDEEIIGENKNSLNSGIFKKGDLLRIRVTPSDGKSNGEAFLSAPVKIHNSPPVIQEIWIGPKVPYTKDNLKVRVKSNDVDGDPVHYTYRWEKNGIALNEESGETLERGRFKKGDSIAVTVIPDDGEESGIPKKSESIVIANGPPLIISSPPTKTDGNIYTYPVKANDPDDDPILFTLKAAPKGMEINKETGLIRWEVQKGDQGAQLIEIEASDGEGAKCFQRYTLSVEFR
jgi:hypothetical protein